MADYGSFLLWIGLTLFLAVCIYFVMEKFVPHTCLPCQNKTKQISFWKNLPKRNEPVSQEDLLEEDVEES
jgi:hypothetical protein